MEREDDARGDEREPDSEPDAEVTEIRAEIEETRIEMGGTLNELGERLDPGTLMNQAKENVREATIGRVEETAQGMSEMVMETIKRNPIPAAMAGAGLALLWKNKSSGNGNGQSGGQPGQGTGGEGPASKAQGVASSVGKNVTGAAGQVGGTISEAGQNVAGAAGQVGGTISKTGQDVGQTLGDGVQEVGWRFERFMDSSPLAMGAIALGAGAVVGAVIPETSKEREYLGDASREVGETVRDAVSQAADEAEKTVKQEAKASS